MHLALRPVLLLKRHKGKGKAMTNKFDHLAKSLAQSTTRRAALKKFGASAAGIALALLGLTKKAEAGGRIGCLNHKDCEAQWGPGYKCGNCTPVYLYGQKFMYCKCYLP